MKHKYLDRNTYRNSRSKDREKHRNDRETNIALNRGTTIERAERDIYIYIYIYIYI